MKYTHRLVNSYDEYNTWQCFSCKNHFVYDGIPGFCPDCGYKLLREFTHKNPKWSQFGLKSSIREYPAFIIEYLPKTVIGNSLGDYFGGFLKNEETWKHYSGFKVDYPRSAKATITLFKSLTDNDRYKSVRISLVKSPEKIDIIYKWDSKNPTVKSFGSSVLASGISQCSG